MESQASGSKRVLAFDIGIKNLAYCLLEKTAPTADAPSGTAKIIAWENVNILSDGTEVGANGKPKKPQCQKCTKSASYGVLGDISGAAVQSAGIYCARHIPTTAPILTDADGKAATKLPTITALKEAAARLALGRPAAGAQKRDEWLGLFVGKCSLPLKAFAKKAPPTMHAGLAALHDGILEMIFADERYDNLLSANQVLLENQPVLKNPTMKSVQVLLFASLRDAFKAEHGSAPPFHLVHAGKKVRGAAAGDAGYAARKEGGEARVKEWLEKNAAGSAWDKKFTAAAKKSDLADALCMCLDATI
jgi:hypothetical protein